jgi:hypothetical protein
MSALDTKLRSQLDGVCQKARDKAEEAALSALQKRAVDAAEPHPHFTAVEKKLRNRLRARGRQAGDVRRTNKTQGIEQLAQELAYEFWHRMLFARFLAENQLLMHPDGVAVSLEDCEELAKSEGVSNGFALAARYASNMLPQIFRTDDVLLEIEFAPEHRLALEKLLAGRPKETFLADDSLGWVYQFWQSKRKEDVNKSGKPIDGRTLPAVTQLFTEDYMVQFLLQNTIGAWWCARQKIKGPPGGAGIPTGKAPVEMAYLRWRDDGTPAAGTFDGWPKTFEEFKLLDPCGGSGHFLVAAFNLLVPLRMHDEGLTAREACDAVLRENLFGLELDPRCTQIAAFALAVAAWKYPGEDGLPLGYRELPPLNIACTGIGPQATEEEWLKLAEQSGKPMSVLSREPILNGLRNLHALFSDAPTLGSLIDPNQLSADLISADYETLQPYLAAALTAETTDDDAHERAVAAAGMVKAAELLAGEYTLVVTNVPYLGRGKQSEALQSLANAEYSESKADLGMMFLERCLKLAAGSGTVALVIPQTLLFLNSFKDLRKSLLKSCCWDIVARLGTGAFAMISGENVNVALLSISSNLTPTSHRMAYLDVASAESPSAKAKALPLAKVTAISQEKQRQNPDSRITGDDSISESLLAQFAKPTEGLSTGDEARYIQKFWEQDSKPSHWEVLQSAPEQTMDYAGLSDVLRWEHGRGELARADGARVQGHHAWGKPGILIARVGTFRFSIYSGDYFDKNAVVLTPAKTCHLPALWCFCNSERFEPEVRRLDKKPYVTTAVFGQITFDLSYWQSVANEKFPNGLPKPHSDDLTQWLFKGDISSSTDPLQVAVARLLGYHWPEQSKTTDAIGRLAAGDGIVGIPAVRSEPSADERLLEVMRAAYGAKWSNSQLHDLLTAAGCKPGTTLDDWLRNAFFEQHCKRFQNRPFIWQIWDGRKDGFSCLLNYHKLNYKTLDNLTHSYLESWIKKQAGDAKTGKAGADLRLAAAQALQEKLKLILVGEPPYDIFVRWKPLHEQPIGWNPDLDDGVRMNIRPFVEAGVLRKTPNIKWTKDRGNEPNRDKDDYPWFWNGEEFVGERVNDFPLTNAQKQAARQRK